VEILQVPFSLISKVRDPGVVYFGTGARPDGGDVVKLSVSKIVCVAFVFIVARAVTSPPQSFTNLSNSNGTNSKMTSSGALTALYSFNYADGEHTIAGLRQANGRNFCGTTYFGVANGAVTSEVQSPGECDSRSTNEPCRTSG
jgi:hypothetical protein